MMLRDYRDKTVSKAERGPAIRGRDTPSKNSSPKETRLVKLGRNKSKEAYMG